VPPLLARSHARPSRLYAIHCAVEGMDAKRSAAAPLSSPAAAQRCAEGAGLDSGAAVEAQSAMPSIALPCSVIDGTRFHQGRRTLGASAPVSNLHQLDGRDLIDHRSFDLPKALRHRIAAKLENIGVAPQKTAKLKEFVPIAGPERISLHDESLPPGLILTS
jgi:hypothetical protein